MLKFRVHFKTVAFLFHADVTAQLSWSSEGEAAVAEISSSFSLRRLVHFLGSDSFLIVRVQNSAEDGAYDARMNVRINEENGKSAAGPSSSSSSTGRALIHFRDAAARDCTCRSDALGCACVVGNPLAKEDGSVEYAFKVETPDLDEEARLGLAPRNFTLIVDTAYLAGKANELKVKRIYRNIKRLIFVNTCPTSFPVAVPIC